MTAQLITTSPPWPRKSLIGISMPRVLSMSNLFLHSQFAGKRTNPKALESRQEISLSRISLSLGINANTSTPLLLCPRNKAYFIQFRKMLCEVPLFTGFTKLRRKRSTWLLLCSFKLTINSKVRRLQFRKTRWKNTLRTTTTPSWL